MSKPRLVLTEDELDVLEAVVAGLRRQQGRTPARYVPDDEAVGSLGTHVMIRRAAEPGQMLVRGPHGDEEVTVQPSPGRGGDAPGVSLFIASGGGIRLIRDEPLRVAVALADAWQEARKRAADARVPSAEEVAEAVAVVAAAAKDASLSLGGVGWAEKAIAEGFLAAGYRKQDKP